MYLHIEFVLEVVLLSFTAYFERKKFFKQECIPVGCVPSATEAVWWEGGGVCSRGSLLPGGVCSGGCLLRGSLLQGGMCLLPGGSALGGCLFWGVSPPGGGGGSILACTEADTPPPVDRMTDTCKNITFATSLRTVKSSGSGGGWKGFVLFLLAPIEPNVCYCKTLFLNKSKLVLHVKYISLETQHNWNASTTETLQRS